jgi:dual specificity protein kinase YAK1
VCPRTEQNLLKRMTQTLIDTYQICNPEFQYMPHQMNPRRDLTHPSEPVYNNGYDNIDFDYILRVSDSVNTPEGKE